MQALIGDYLGQTTLGDAQTHKNLTIFPVLSKHEIALDYLTLDEALEGDLLDITELDEGASVPRLLLKNPSDRRVLILDGEELVGANQNRIVNTSILVAAGAKLQIPVSCVEQGRWDHVSSKFGTQRRMMYAGLRAAKADQVLSSVRMTGTFDANQGEIWHQISARTIRGGTMSPTNAMADVYEHEAGSLQEYVDAFEADSEQVGAVFALDGKVVGLECFGRHDTMALVFPKLVQSYALDAVDNATKRSTTQPPVPPSSATRFMQAVARANMEARPSVGEGTDVRIDSKTVTGLGLVLDDSLLHLSAFRRVAKTNMTSNMARFSQRRM